MAGGEFSVIPMAGSSVAGAASPCEKVSCITSQRRGDLGFAHSVLLELSLDGVQVHSGPGQSNGSAV